MIKVQIGEAIEDYENITESWINRQINVRQRDGLSACIKVTINSGSLNMILSTPGCTAISSNPRPPTLSEKEIFDLWDHRGLNDEQFTGGSLIAFLKQLRRWVS